MHDDAAWRLFFSPASALQGFGMSAARNGYQVNGIGHEGKQ
jgi:hypothetical protein